MKLPLKFASWYLYSQLIIMKNNSFGLTIFIGIIWASISFSWGADLLRVQGRLTDFKGNPIGGGEPIVQFEIYSSATGGSLLWSGPSNHKVFPNQAGLFSTEIGPFNTGFFKSGTEYFLQIKVRGVAGFQALNPRQKLATVPFSFHSNQSDRAGIADTVPDNAIQSKHIQDGSITSNHIGTKTIDGSKLQESSVVGIHIATDAIRSHHIKDGSVTVDDLADGVVSPVFFSSRSIEGWQLIEMSITAKELAPDSVTNEKIKLNAVTSNKILDDTIQDVDIQSNAITNSKIKDEAVTTEKIKDYGIQTVDITTDAITEVKLADGSVKEAKLANNSVTTNKLFSSAVTEVKIADKNVTTPKLADKGVTTPKLDDGSVTTPKLGVGSVSGSKLADNSVSTSKIPDGQVTPSKLSLTALALFSPKSVQHIQVDLTSRDTGSPFLAQKNVNINAVDLNKATLVLGGISYNFGPTSPVNYSVSFVDSSTVKVTINFFNINPGVIFSVYFDVIEWN